MMQTHRRRACAALAALALALAAPAALGQQPASGRPLRVILPVSAGSGVDTIVRAVSPALAKTLAQPVVVENLAGAGGIIGTQAIVKAAPDGLTIGVVSNNHVTNPGIFKKLPYDSLADITPISVLGTTPFVLVVNPRKLPVADVRELVALLKARPGKFNYASSGNGTIIHLAGAMFLQEAGADARHVPYKGVGPMVTDLIGGQVDFGVVALNAVQPHLRSGALRAIGVTSPARTPVLPELPTVAEQGLPDYAVDGWFAAVAPAKLPPEEVKRLHAGLVAALATPEVAEAMARQGNVIAPTTPEAAAQRLRAETEKYARVIQAAAISAD